MVWSYSTEQLSRRPDLNFPGTPAQRLVAQQGVSSHARENSHLSLATGPILLIRSQLDLVPQSVVPCRLSF